MGFDADSLSITPQILSPTAALDELKGAWKALGMLAPERLPALRHAATIESIGSSTRIDGAKLSDPEVERLLSRLEIRSPGTRGEQEGAVLLRALRDRRDRIDRLAGRLRDTRGHGPRPHAAGCRRRRAAAYTSRVS